MDIQNVDEAKSFTYTDYFSDEQGTLKKDMPVLTITNEFIEEDGKTRIVSRCTADIAEHIEELIKAGHT